MDNISSTIAMKMCIYFSNQGVGSHHPACSLANGLTKIGGGGVGLVLLRMEAAVMELRVIF